VLLALLIFNLGVEASQRIFVAIALSSIANLRPLLAIPSQKPRVLSA
jgi:hypothetical protein